jgi:hypothetical protein
MKNNLYEQMYETYKQGYSLAEVGKIYGMTRQSVFVGFSRRKYELRKKEPLPYLYFEGMKFTLRNTGYYGRTDGKRELMHRVVWEHYNGKIPKGHDIHHKDHDKENNIIDNLELYTKAEHAKKFATGNNQHGKNN